ncbi:hypothetical protein COHA_007583 [Chlorella ohadii]|uniref:Histone deacetylase domain-containing protein n=1 Tax=Chlorella ohadii TaxID=2649997 RepID=A0AAD5H440_9CHLO|nr:hypothetical protein COHA_007583 [Chlorella ohadii]
MARLIYAIEAAPGHQFPGHPECPGRVEAIQQALQSLRVFAGCADGQVEQLGTPPSQLPEGLLETVHTAGHVAELRATSARLSGPTAVRDPDDPDGPTYATPTSYTDALRAACTAVALIDALVASSSGPAGKSNGSGGVGGGSAGSSSGSAGGSQQPLAASAFSICRPPGHHATAVEQMGFCLLNNAALAARHAQRAHGLQKVLILDWDVHHGNGTQDLFYDDPSVLFVDLHQEHVWPGSGALEETGTGAGAGATINVPLAWHSGHAAFQRAFERVVAPAARRFAPDLVIVSAGYDAHYEDPLEKLQLQAGSYHWLAAAVRRLAEELCGGRLLLLLEGGYNQQALGQSVAETVLALLGKPSAHPLLEASQLPHPEPLGQVDAAIERVRQQHGL